MSRVTQGMALALFVPVLGVCAGAAPASKAPSAYAFLGGTVYTVDAENTVAEAMVIRDDRIVYVGDATGAQAHMDDHTEVVDTKGKMVLPGFIDTHIHAATVGLEAEFVALDPHDSVDAWLGAIEAYADKHPDLSIIQGGAVDVGRFDNGPHRALLDAIEPHRPVVISDFTGHNQWVNSKALELAGIHKSSLVGQPEARFIQVDDEGHPTGWLRGGAAIFYLRENLPDAYALDDPTPLDPDAFMERSEPFFTYLHTLGITSVFDAGMMGNEARVGTALGVLDRQGRMPIRMVASYFVAVPRHFEHALEQLDALKALDTADRFRFGAIKVSVDGTFESQTASLLEPYTNNPSNMGDTKISPEALTAFVVEADAAGVDLYFHTIGDRAVREALDAIEAAREANQSIGTTRHTLSHLHMVHDADLHRFAELDVMAQTTPIWHHDTPHYRSIIGDRADLLFRFASISEQGGRAIYGSDFPVAGPAPLAPLFNMESGQTRRMPGDRTSPPLLPLDERLTIQQLIRGYTADAAHLLRMEDQIGTLEVGKKADVVVLSHDLLEVDPEDIANKVVVERTFLDGVQVHRRTWRHAWRDVKLWVFGTSPL